MTAWLFTAVALLAIAVPRILRLDTPPPALGIALWSGALLLRAAVTLVVLATGLALAAASDYAQDVAHLLWHTDLPSVAGRTGADGHTVIDAVVLLPAIAIAVAISYGVLRSARTARALRSAIDRTELGEGPGGSVLVAERLPLVAAVGLVRSRVVVSASALALLDDQELAAAIEHERAHIHRGHRFILLFAAVCATASRWQPGTSRDLARLAYELERDADRRAATDPKDRLALASAICKVAMGRQAAPASVAAQCLHGVREDGVVARVRELTGDAPEPRQTVRLQGAGVVIATGLAMIAVMSVGIHAVIELNDAVRVLAHHPAD